MEELEEQRKREAADQQRQQQQQEGKAPDVQPGAAAPARQEARIALQGVALSLSVRQYAGCRALLEVGDAYAANAPYRLMKPKMRPAPGERMIWA